MLTATPRKTITWNVNYYLGQEHPDRNLVSLERTDPGSVRANVSGDFAGAPDGKLHIFDSYVSWQTAPKLTFALEGDYVIRALVEEYRPGESSSPSHVIGGGGLREVPIYAEASPPPGEWSISRIAADYSAGSRRL